MMSIPCANDETYYCGLLVTMHSLVSYAKEGSRFIGHVLGTGLYEERKADLTSRLFFWYNEIDNFNVKGV